MKKLFVGFMIVFCISEFVYAEPAVDYDQNTTPALTDELIGIDDPAGSWAVNRYPISSIFGLYSLVKNKVDATEAPDGDNDVDEGYSAGSIWVDVTNDNYYVCVDASDGAASWVLSTSTGKVDITGETDAIDFGGAASLEIPNGTDPDVDTAGQISNDTDGANVTGDVSVRAFDGTNQWPVGTKLQTIQLPFTTAGAVTNWQPWFNLTGMTFTITNVYFRSDTDDLAIEIDECTSIHNLTVLNTIHQSAVGGTVSTDGTNVYYLDVAAGSLDSTTIETTHGLSFDFGEAAEGLIIIEGWFNADVD